MPSKFQRADSSKINNKLSKDSFGGHGLKLRLLAPLGAALWTASLSSLALAQSPCEDSVARLVSAQGKVEARVNEKSSWRPAALNDTLCAGYMIRVGARSRAALLLANDTVLRLDQHTTVTFSAVENQDFSWLELISGVGHFISRVPRALKVKTPFVNAAVEGTEFVVSVTGNEANVTVFEGKVWAENAAGRLVLDSGQTAVARTAQAPVTRVVVRPRDAVQWALYYPPIFDRRLAQAPAALPWQKAVANSLDAYYAGDTVDAFAAIENVSEPSEAEYFTHRAALKLVVGRVDEARKDISRAQQINSQNAHAIALQSVIALTQNEKDRALALARQASDLDPTSVPALVALSYARQGQFDIADATMSMERAIAQDREDPLSWARLAELHLSLGDLDRALDAAQTAVGLNSRSAHTQSVLGYAYLTRIEVDNARRAFEQSIAYDSTYPLARLGLGLAIIRTGDLVAGRREIEIAASLDPNNALVRSYLGKAYYEEKRDRLAESQLAMAKSLDDKDPTPWFYDAIRKQMENRPIEALYDLQKSIELNDNRAVYRSRLLLDGDLAARSASLGQIYRDLGFEQLALVEGWKSVNTDPSNHSGHRFLADTYSALPRHEIARVSELLQSQLLQPINITPLQPQLAESDLFILNGAGPSAPAFNEFNPLFARNRVAFQANGIVGNNNTSGDDLVLSGIQNKISYSVGQFHYETDGFRENNDLKSDVYNLFVQTNLQHNTSVQAEIRTARRKGGDLNSSFDQSGFSTTFREEQKIDSARFGFHHTFSPKSEIIGSLIYQSFDFDQNDVQVFPAIPPFFPAMTLDKNTHRERDGSIAELQHQYRTKNIGLISGIGHVDQHLEQSLFLGGIRQANAELDQDIRKNNIYVYSQIDVSSNLSLTAGLSADSLEIGKQFDDDQLNPKVGLTWNPLPQTTVRLAAFRVLSSTLTFNQTIERTHVAGFNQFFDDINGSDVDRIGAAVDHKFSSSTFAGIEYSKRELEVPRFGTAGTKASFFDWEEWFRRAYLYWTPSPRTAVSVEYQNERFDRDISFNQGIVKLHTNRLPVGLGFFHPSGFTLRLLATHIDQAGDFSIPADSGTVFSGKDNFWILDVEIDYRLKKRRGLLSVGVKNLFEREFNFHEVDFDNPTVNPGRLVFARFALAY